MKYNDFIFNIEDTETKPTHVMICYKLKLENNLYGVSFNNVEITPVEIISRFQINDNKFSASFIGLKNKRVYTFTMTFNNITNGYNRSDLINGIYYFTTIFPV